MGFMLIGGVIIILVSWIRNDISGILYGLFYIVGDFVWRSTEQRKEDRERAEEEQKEKLAKLSDEFQKKIDASEEQIKKLKDDLLLKDIILTLGCSPDDAPRYLSLIHDTGLTYEFEDASYADKREIIYNAEKIAAFYKDELTPSIQRMHCPITFSDYILYKSSFSDDIYSDIPLDQKTLMVYRHINNDDDLPSNKNELFLLELVRKDNSSVYNKLLTSYEKMSNDDIHYFFNLFVREFGFNDFWEADFENLIEHVSDDSLSFRYISSLTTIFNHCLYSFSFFYFPEFIEQTEDDIRDFYDFLWESCFIYFARDLFFSYVYYDITDFRNIILKKKDYYLKLLKESHQYYSNLS